jgi:hypothetical protein
MLDEAVNWCRERGVEFYAVNRDYPEETTNNNQHFSRKIKVDYFIDDRNLGGLPDWGTIYRMVSRHKTWHDIIIEAEQNASLRPYEELHPKKAWWKFW